MEYQTRGYGALICFVYLVQRYVQFMACLTGTREQRSNGSKLQNAKAAYAEPEEKR